MELAISIISLVTAIIALLAAVLPSASNLRRNAIDFCNKYNQMKSEVVAALTLYSQFYHNPVDLAETEDHKLPNNYDDASVELRKLGATACALAAIIPEKEKHLPISKADLMNVSGNLIGLSNSMCTPYNSGSSLEDRAAVRAREAEIRKLLRIEESAS